MVVASMIWGRPLGLQRRWGSYNMTSMSEKSSIAAAGRGCPFLRLI